MDDWLFLLETVRVSWRKAGQPKRVTAAVSGGMDSVAMLHALGDVSREEGFCLSAAHVDHGLRDNSSLDAEFVRDMCAGLGIPCRVYTVQVQGKSEDAARAARYDALHDACDQDCSDALALAHHQRDQAETVLLHLFRGSGGDGLAGMKECRTWTQGKDSTVGQDDLLLWRPFLSASPDKIQRAMIQRGIPWREDETNAGDAYLRNYIRHNVLPAVTARIPQAEEAMGRAANLFAEENAFFRQEAQRFLERDGNARLNGPCSYVRYEPLKQLHPALQRHVLRLACPVSIDMETTENLLALSPGRKMNLPEDWRAECTKNYLHFVSPDRKTFPLPPAALRILPRQNETGDGKRTQALPRRVFEACELRFGKPGDMIRPLGGPGTKKMQDYWVDRKIDRPFRMYMPLLCLENRVVWAIGVGAGEEARVTPGDDAVLLEYAGYLPFDLPPTSDETKAK